MENRAFWKFKKISLLVVMGIATVTLATPPVGIVLNQIVATGTSLADISEILHVGSNPNRGGENQDAENEDWQLHLRTHGATDFYVQHIVVGPGGYSGWHTHPGLLIGTVVSGDIDFYDANCQKRSFTARAAGRSSPARCCRMRGSGNATQSWFQEFSAARNACKACCSWCLLRRNSYRL